MGLTNLTNQESLPSPPALTTNKHIPIEKIVHLIGEKGLSLTETGKILGIAKQTVAYHCERHGITNKGVESYRKHRLALIDSKESLILNALTVDDTNKATLMQKATTFAILYDKGRLESDKSTANINVQGVLSKIDSKLQDLEEEKERLEE